MRTGLICVLGTGSGRCPIGPTVLWGCAGSHFVCWENDPESPSYIFWDLMRKVPAILGGWMCHGWRDASTPGTVDTSPCQALCVPFLLLSTEAQHNSGKADTPKPSPFPSPAQRTCCCSYQPHQGSSCPRSEDLELFSAAPKEAPLAGCWASMACRRYRHNIKLCHHCVPCVSRCLPQLQHVPG